MKKKGLYGFEGYYADRILDFELAPITEAETKNFHKEKTEGIPVKGTENTVLTVFKKDGNRKRKREVDISSACRSGSRVALFVILSPKPTLFAYTDEERFGYFPLP
ncbi:MAG: hypothetical protein IKZ28_01825 [Clostridia bacterium]|nr:hypothetical protein [Clostridia bacterium]